ncbi:hypothetical protein EVAR_45759_1 [Eumeta japonica]|uniref:CCHC-type domain-containing protein n=1 Tax=Eumeta variegata TaxID=151549 RepID=A0A4C1YWP4_EUMVA|nr:hypothetical protein EVAR_45759_1 [Eumeta japonica]
MNKTSSLNTPIGPSKNSSSAAGSSLRNRAARELLRQWSNQKAEREPELRYQVIAMDRVYIEWEAIVVYDHIDVTCCYKCHQYGHPAAHCRSKDIVCSKCGDVGHEADTWAAMLSGLEVLSVGPDYCNCESYPMFSG